MQKVRTLRREERCLWLRLWCVEKALVKLRKQQQDKIEEVKQKTNYYSMRNLIERYEGGPGPTPPETPASLRRRVPPQVPQPVPQTPQRNLQVAPPQTPALGTMSPGLQQQLSRKWLH